MDEYKKELLRQRENIVGNLGLRHYFQLLYADVSKELEGFDKVLEVGAGAGVSGIFLSNKVIRTDVVPFEEFGVAGNYNMEALTFDDDTFDAVLAFDSIHHSALPRRALAELIRVTRGGGKVILIEPFVSPLSYLPYKLFHHEETSWKFKEITPRNFIGSMNPAFGDQGVSRFLIRELLKDRLEFFPHVYFSTKYLSPFSFFATGGVSNPFQTSIRTIEILFKIEKLIPVSLLKFLASRVIISIQK